MQGPAAKGNKVSKGKNQGLEQGELRDKGRAESCSVGRQEVGAPQNFPGPVHEDWGDSKGLKAGLGVGKHVYMGSQDVHFGKKIT